MHMQRTCSEITKIFSRNDAKNAKDIKEKLSAFASWRKLIIPNTSVDSALGPAAGVWAAPATEFCVRY